MSSKAEKTRHFIIEKTAAVFNAKGFAGTSLHDLTEVTGLSKGSIYGNFENKDEVALAAFDYNFNCIASYIRDRIQSKKTAVDKLLVYPEIYRQYLQLPFLAAGCPLLNTAVEADDTHPALRQKAQKALQSWKVSLERILSQGIEQGELKETTPVFSFSTILISLIEGAVMQAKLNGKAEALQVTMDYLESIIIDLKKTKQ